MIIVHMSGVGKIFVVAWEIKCFQLNQHLELDIVFNYRFISMIWQGIEIKFCLYYSK